MTEERKEQLRELLYNQTDDREIAELFDEIARLEALCRTLKDVIATDAERIQWKDAENQRLRTAFEAIQFGYHASIDWLIKNNAPSALSHDASAFRAVAEAALKTGETK